MCKGHPGNREAAVDREINKQKERERSDGRRFAWWFAGLTTGQHLRSTLQKLQGLWGVRPLLSFAIFVCMSLLLVFSDLSLFFLPSLCALSTTCVAFLCSFCLPPLSLWGLKAHRQYRLLKPFWTEASLCICQCWLFLFASIWGEPETSLLLSLQDPKKVSDPWMTLSLGNAHI